MTSNQFAYNVGSFIGLFTIFLFLLSIFLLIIGSIYFLFVIGSIRYGNKKHRISFRQAIFNRWVIIISVILSFTIFLMFYLDTRG